MKLYQPYYIEKRSGNSHINLNGKWDFCWTDCEAIDSQDVKFEYECNLPKSVYYCLYEAGILPHPYEFCNSSKYHWVDEKVWYFRKIFTVKDVNFSGNAYLCFDGVSYYSRVWLNGKLLGEHEGMFGGPCCDIAEYLILGGSNEIVVEIKACNFGQKQGYDCRNARGQNTAIVPWNLVRDNFTSNGDFIVFGIWNNVRLELLPKLHLSRPYMVTESIADDEAKIQFEVEISDGSVKELKRFFGIENGIYDYTRAYDSGNTGAVREEAVDIEIIINGENKRVFYSKEKVSLTDFASLGMDDRFWELQFYKKEITISNPKLWYPNGMGDPFLYDVTVNLLFDNKLMDTHSFKHGIRSFTASYTKGNKYRARWNKFLFSVNGQETYLKGMNWTPIDFLFDISPERYEWCLTLAKNAGIQLLRVWNGGGMPETDTFYEICDRLGIMVWQDLFLANSVDNSNYPHDVLECQTAYNLYRIRNHASLVILCGGNEFNPYTVGNAAAMFVMQRTVESLAPDRVYYYTTADQGSAHIYIDMEPVWYRHRYKHLPFLAESGIHSFPSFKTIKRFIGKDEYEKEVCNLASPTFEKDFPSLINHMSEYLPDRVPRMMARNSQIIDLNTASLENVCEASQIQVYEFYQLMIQSMQENFPFCGGIMPWVFKRPWPTVGIQTVDGDDRPGYAYYAVLNSYKPVNVCWCQEWSVLAPQEEISLIVKTFNQNNENLTEAEVSLTVFNPDLTVYKAFKSKYMQICDFGKIRIPIEFTDKCFLVSADISENGKLLNRSVYFNKCTGELNDKELYENSRTAPTKNMYFKNGPWLKASITGAKQSVIDGEILQRGVEGKYPYADIIIKNISNTPAYPITLDLTDDNQRCFLNENFFLLMPGEEKKIRITCDKGEIKEVKVDFWNGAPLLIS